MGYQCRFKFRKIVGSSPLKRWKNGGKDHILINRIPKNEILPKGFSPMLILSL